MHEDEDDLARQFFLSPVDQDRDVIHTVLVDEPCPHCRVKLHMPLSLDMGHRGFACPECGKGLIRMRHSGSKVLALIGVTFSVGTFSVLTMVAAAGVQVCVTTLLDGLDDFLLFSFAMVLLGLCCTVFMVVLFFRITLANLRVGWRLLHGARLLPAIETGGTYHYEAVPLRFKFRRSKGGEELLGAMSITSGDDVDTLQGALTEDHAPRNE